MITDKAQVRKFKGVLWFVAMLAMVVISLLSAMDHSVSAQEAGLPGNLTPVSTIEAPPEISPSQPVTHNIQVMAASIATRIPVGTSPNGIALNPNTRQGYVINSTSSNVSILETSANTHIRNLWAGQKLYWGIALKPGTDRLYVSDNARGQVLELQEESGSVISTISLGNVFPEGIAINSKLNKAYVAHSGNLLSVINLSTNQVTKVIDTGYYNHLIAVNETNNRVYVTRSEYNRVTVIDGSTDTYLQAVPVGSSPWGVAVNSKTNLIYVANSGSNSVSVINGTSHSVINTIPVQSRPFGIAVNEEANRIYVANVWSNSVSIIDGNTNQVVETVANVGSYPSGIATNPKTGKIYVTNEVGNNVTVILDSAAVPPPSTLTPIILVPGYYASYNKHRMYPSPNNYPDKWEWWPLPIWFCPFDQARCTYQPLIDALEAVGYDSDPNSPTQNLFTAYYNWLRPNSESAINDLAPVVAQALVKTGANKVHIITHSNGGLVTRNWIQNQAASTVVDKLIMLAPPNYGVARVYPAWAGGDISREGAGKQTFIFDGLMSAYEAPLTCLGNFLDRYCYYTDATYHTFIHQHITSARDLIPVYDFLIGPDGQFKNYQAMHPDNINLALETMNQNVQNGLVNKVGNITIVAGTGHDTTSVYKYQSCANCGALWLDGKVSGDIKLNGDDTVPRAWAQLPGINPTIIVSGHGEIVKKAIPQIFEILQLPAASSTSEITSSEATPLPTPIDTLVFTVVRHVNTAEASSNGTFTSNGVEANNSPYSVPVHLLITDPLGRKLGYQTNGTFINQIPYAFYQGDANEPKIIAIPNPIEGNYRTQVIGNNSGTYGIVVATQKLDRILKVINGATAPGQIANYDIMYTPPAEIYLPLINKN